jgi:hypothetical protein
MGLFMHFYQANDKSKATDAARFRAEVIRITGMDLPQYQLKLGSATVPVAVRNVPL